uniref:Putative secreted protein n=1 Tax=Ixodes ricinus TaxID=34613 RepID=V5ID14_IXORI
MFLYVIWILATARTGSCSYSCQSDYKVDVCYLDPVKGEGNQRHEHVFYDWRTGACLTMKFGHWDTEEEQNRFQGEDECHLKCRPGLRNECFQVVWEGRGDKKIKMWTYNYSSTKCVPFTWRGQGQKKKPIQYRGCMLSKV